MAFVVSLQTGKVKTYGDAQKLGFLEKEWQSGFFKEVRHTPVMAFFGGLEGDEVADKAHHGGLDKAIFANSYENYPHWASYLGVESLPFGALGENLTISNLHEKSVMLGDIHMVGEAILQVTQPRKPCWKISRRWNNKSFTSKIYTSGLSGWYYRVLKEGYIKKNDEIIVKPQVSGISILDANMAFCEPLKNRAVLEEILKLDVASLYKKSIILRLEGKSNLSYMSVED